MQRIFETRITCPPLLKYLQARLNCRETTNSLMYPFQAFYYEQCYWQFLLNGRYKTVRRLGGTLEKRDTARAR